MRWNWFRRKRKEVVESVIDDATDILEERIEEKKVELGNVIPALLVFLPVIDIIARAGTSGIAPADSSKHFTLYIENVNITIS